VKLAEIQSQLAEKADYAGQLEKLQEAVRKPLYSGVDTACA